MKDKQVLVIGIGNEFARDDAAGLCVAREVKEKIRGNVKVVESSGEGTSLIEQWEYASAVIVADAVWSGAEPGTIRRFDAAREALPAESFRTSTHAFGLYEATELARSLGQLPGELIVFGIEGGAFTAGVGLSPAIEQAVHKVAGAILDELEKLPEIREPRAR